MSRSFHIISFLAALVLVLSPIFAESAAAEPAPEPVVEVSPGTETVEEVPSAGMRAAAAGLAVVPGVLVHGAGHWMAGDTDTALNLLVMEGVGIGLLLGGFAGLAVTGAASEFVAPLTWAALGGSGLFLGSWAGDLYGVLAPPGGTGSPQRLARDWELSLGYQFHHNPSFEHNHFGFAGAEARYSGLRVTPRFWYAFDDPNWRVDLDAAWRFWGARPNREAKDGSYLELESGYAHHEYTTQGFRENVFDLQLKSRFDGVRLADSLDGAFMDFWMGMAIAEYRRDFGDSDTTTVLLGGTAIGSYLGHGENEWGEWALFMDHRHDDFAGGLLLPSIPSGIAGSFGGRVEKHVWRGFGVRASAEVGAAFVGNIHLVYREGGRQ